MKTLLALITLLAASSADSWNAGYNESDYDACVDSAESMPCDEMTDNELAAYAGRTL